MILFLTTNFQYDIEIFNNMTILGSKKHTFVTGPAWNLKEEKKLIVRVVWYIGYLLLLYRVIQTSLRDFRPLRYSSRVGHAKGEHVNRGRDTPSFCPTLHVLGMSTFSDAASVNPVIKFMPHTVNHVA
jgi:hypothetical protein